MERIGFAARRSLLRQIHRCRHSQVRRALQTRHCRYPHQAPRAATRQIPRRFCSQVATALKTRRLADSLQSARGASRLADAADSATAFTAQTQSQRGDAEWRSVAGARGVAPESAATRDQSSAAATAAATAAAAEGRGVFEWENG